MRLLGLLAVLVVAGCAGGSAVPEAEPPAAAPVRQAPPSWLGGRFADDALEFRYPTGWKRTTSERWGELLSDNRSRHPAFVSVRYLDESLPETLDAYAGLAAATLRPPDGAGLTLLYTQTAYLGSRRAYEATFVWQTRASTPLGPRMRTIAAELRSGHSVFVVLAAERPVLHAGAFRWILATLELRPQPARVRKGPRSYGWSVGGA